MAPYLSVGAGDDTHKNAAGTFPAALSQYQGPVLIEQTGPLSYVERVFVPRTDRLFARKHIGPRQAFIAALTASAVIGNDRTRAPTALKIALASAGAITVTAGSPTPVACSPLAMMVTATSGI